MHRVSTFPWRTSVAACAASVLLFATTCSASTLTFSQTGLSAAGTPLDVSATLATGSDAGGANLLKITLRNSGPATVFKADVLSSFYFNLADPSGTTPLTLTFNSGTGQAYQVLTGTADVPVAWTPNLGVGQEGGTWSFASSPSSLVAVNTWNEGWQFRTTSPPPVPGYRFGIGTVGNSFIASHLAGATSFESQVVSGTETTIGESMLNLGIFSTGTSTVPDITPNANLDGRKLVWHEAVFSFTSSQSLAGFDPTWVPGSVAFGFGTEPDSVLVPEPCGLAIAAVGALLAAGSRWRRRRRPRA